MILDLMTVLASRLQQTNLGQVAFGA